MPRVFVINRSAHNFSAAEQYGELVYMSEGSIDKYSVVDMDRQFRQVLRHSTKEDYILLTSMTVMCSIACIVFARKHDCLNLLLLKGNRYVERRLRYDHLEDGEREIVNVRK